MGKLRSDGQWEQSWQRLTPAQKIIPVQMLLLGKYSHHNQCVQVNPLAEHPEIVTAQHVHVEEVQYLAANLRRGGEVRERSRRAR